MPTKKALRRAALAAAVAASLVAGEAQFNQYDMDIVRYIDSDTYRAVIHLWPGQAQTIDVRVEGIDTPEKYRPSKKCRAHERALAKEALGIAQGAMESAARVYVTGVGLGKYAGRVIGKVVLVNKSGEEALITDLLMASGLAVEYHGGTKVKDWCLVKR